MPLTVVRSSSPMHSPSEHGARGSDPDHRSWQEDPSPQSPHSQFQDTENVVDWHGVQFSSSVGRSNAIFTFEVNRTEFLDLFYAYIEESQLQKRKSEANLRHT